MRVQVLIHGGPFDGTLTTLHAVSVPRELRLARFSARDEEQDINKIPASHYRLIDEEKQVHGRTVFASYQYVGPVESAISLVDHWEREE